MILCVCVVRYSFTSNAHQFILFLTTFVWEGVMGISTASATKNHDTRWITMALDVILFSIGEVTAYIPKHKHTFTSHFFHLPFLTYSTHNCQRSHISFELKRFLGSNHGLSSPQLEVPWCLLDIYPALEALGPEPRTALWSTMYLFSREGS